MERVFVKKFFTRRERVQALTDLQPEVPSLSPHTLFWALPLLSSTSKERTPSLARMVLDLLPKSVVQIDAPLIETSATLASLPLSFI